MDRPVRLIIGCGYLGRRVAIRWLAQGQRVFATTRSPGKALELAGLGAEPVVCDVLDCHSLRQLPLADTVLHCIGHDRTTSRPMRETYVDGLAKVLALLALPPRFIYVSSTSVYGQTDGEEVEETSATDPAEESGQVMLAAEQVLRQRYPAAVILRLAGIYGPGRLLRQNAVEKGTPIVGDPARWLNLIHVEDAADAVLAAEANGQPGRTYNVADDRPVRRREFYAALAGVLGAPEPRFVVPDPASPSPGHERANRRISNRRLHEQLRVQLRYPTYESGLPASIPRA